MCGSFYCQSISTGFDSLPQGECHVTGYIARCDTFNGITELLVWRHIRDYTRYLQDKWNEVDRNIEHIKDQKINHLFSLSMADPYTFLSL